MSNRETQWLLREKYNGEKTPDFFADIKRLKAGEPVDYVIGWKPFLGCRIDLSRRPLIPRPETEYWVENAIAEIHAERREEPVRCLDVFAGSGCIGLSLLAHLPHARVDFIDNDPRAVQQIRINKKLNTVAPYRSRIITASARAMPKKRYDYVFANPPYIPVRKKPRIGRSVTRWEPHNALFAKENGLLYVRHCIRSATALLLPRGRMYIEFDAPQKRSLERFCKEHASMPYRFHKDQYGKWRMVELHLLP